MTRPFEPIDPVETLLAELEEARTAGVFEPTRVNRDQVRNHGEQPVPGIIPMLRQTRVWVPLATAAILAIVVTGATFKYQIGEAHEQARLAGRLSSGDGTSLAAASPIDGLTGCLNGPGTSIPGDCRSHDRDADGDVDLADIQAYQLAYARP